MYNAGNIRLSLILLLVTVCAIFYQVKAEDFEIKINLKSFPDTLYQKDSIEYKIDIKNIGSGDFDDDISINYMIADTLPANIPGDLVIHFSDTLIIDLDPDSSIEFEMSMYIDPGLFTGNGSSIIIIWPTATSIDTAIDFNMSTKNVRVEFPLGIWNIRKNDRFKLYPNPTSGQITLFNLVNEPSSNGEIRIYNSVGKLMNTYQDLPKLNKRGFTIPTIDSQGSQLPDGIYFIEYLNDKARKVNKIVIAR